MIASIIDNLKKGDYYGAGDCTEIAKGKHEMVTSFKDVLKKAKRYGKRKR